MWGPSTLLHVACRFPRTYAQCVQLFYICWHIVGPGRVLFMCCVFAYVWALCRACAYIVCLYVAFYRAHGVSFMVYVCLRGGSPACLLHVECTYCQCVVCTLEKWEPVHCMHIIKRAGLHGEAETHFHGPEHIPGGLPVRDRTRPGLGSLGLALGFPQPEPGESCCVHNLSESSWRALLLVLGRHPLPPSPPSPCPPLRHITDRSSLRLAPVIPPRYLTGSAPVSLQSSPSIPERFSPRIPPVEPWCPISRWG